MAEQLRIDVVADATEFKRELQGAERFARDTGKKIEADTLIKLRLNVLDVENKVGAVKKQLKDKNLSEPDAIRLRLDLQTYKSNLTEARRSLRNYINTGEADLSRFGRSFKLLGNKIVGFFKGAILFGGVAGALSAIGGFFRSGREDALAFESAFAGVKKTIDTSEEGFLLLNNQLEKLSLTIPVAFEELAKIAELGGQLGVSAGGIAQFTETVAKIAATTNLTSEEASTAFAKIANVLDVPIGKIEEMANVVVDLGNNFATTEKDIVNFTQRIASGGAVAGVASTDLFAIATAFSSVGIQAEAGGTAVNKAFLKINEAVAKGGEDLEGFADAVGLSSDAFSEIFNNDSGEAFRLFVAALDEQGDSAVETIEDLIGSDIRLKNAFLSLANNSDILTDALARGNGQLETQNALTDEANKRFITTESRIQLQTNALRLQRAELSAATNDIKIFATKALTGLASGINKVAFEERKAKADRKGYLRSTDDITRGAETAEEAIVKLGAEYDRLADLQDSLLFSNDKYAEALEDLDSITQSYADGLRETLLTRVRDANTAFLDGSLTAEQYGEELRDVGVTAQRMGISVGQTDAIVDGLNQVLGSLSTVSTQGELDALVAKANQLTDSANSAIIAISQLGATDVGPIAFKPQSVDDINASIDGFLKVEKLKAQVDNFAKDLTAEGFKPKDVIKSTSSGGGGGGGAKRDPEREAEEQARELLKIKEDELRERTKLQVDHIRKTEQNEYKKAQYIAELEEQLSSELIELKKGDTEAYFDANKKIIKGYEEQEKVASKSLDGIIDSFEDGIENLQEYEEKIDDIEDKFASLKDSVVSEIQEINKELGEVGSDSDEQLASRFLEVKKSIEELEEVRNNVGPLEEEDRKKLKVLEEERRLLNESTTKEIRKQAVEYEALSETQKLLVEREKEIAKLNERKDVAQAFQGSGLEDPRISLGEDTNGVLQAFYEDDLGNLVQIVDEKNIEYARDLLNQQTTLDTELQQIRTSKALELETLKQFNADRIAQEESYKRVFGDSYSYQISKIKDLQTQMNKLISLRTEAGLGGGGVGNSVSNTTNDNRQTFVTLDSRSSVKNQVALRDIQRITAE